jgi:hypothetical protein
LNELKGVGPATSTAILTLFNDSVPFMSDEGMEEVLKVTTHSYTKATMHAYMLEMKKWVKYANNADNDIEESPGKDGGGEKGGVRAPICASDIEKAIWAKRRLNAQGELLVAAGKRGVKRKTTPE